MKSRTQIILIVLFCIFACFLGSCASSGCNSSKKSDTKPRHSYKRVIIDSCEYIEVAVPNTALYSLTHKRNCSNPIHKY